MLYRVSPKVGIAGDICEPLIELWRRIKECPAGVNFGYTLRWKELQHRGPTYYYEVRERFNRTGDPHDLLFITRTCVNGLIRFNQKGEMNNSFHLTRPGIHPDRLHPVIKEWSRRIQGTDFRSQSFEETLDECGEGDFVYLDPPYAGTKGQYYGKIDQSSLFAAVAGAIGRGAKVAMSYDGTAGGKDHRTEMPAGLFETSIPMAAGNSPFRATQMKQDVKVVDTLWLSYDPPTQ